MAINENVKTITCYDCNTKQTVDVLVWDDGYICFDCYEIDQPKAGA